MGTALNMLAVRSLTVFILILDIYISATETIILNTQDDAGDTLSLQDDRTIIKRTGSHHGTGTGCVVKGSYCRCHYCKCEKGQLHCQKKGLGSHKGFGKRYCYGSMEGEYCHCDYCRCKHGYGLTAHPSGHTCTY